MLYQVFEEERVGGDVPAVYVSYDICVYHFRFVFFPWVFLHSRDWSLSCEHGLDYAGC